MTTDELIEKVRALSERHETVQLFHMIPELVTEIRRLQRSAKRYAENSDYWRNECTKLLDANYGCSQGIKCPYLQKEMDAKYENLKSAWREMFASKQLVLGDLDKMLERLTRSEILQQIQRNQIERLKTRFEKLARIAVDDRVLIIKSRPDPSGMNRIKLPLDDETYQELAKNELGIQ